MTDTSFFFAHDASIADLPNLSWRLVVRAVCPKCGGLAILGSRDGGACLYCSECGWQVESAAAECPDVARELLAAVAADQLPR